MVTRAWNTGRKYSAKGQRIAITIMPDRKVGFADIDRMIWGVTRDALPAGRDTLIETFVLDQYDFGSYDAPSIRSGADYDFWKALEVKAGEI